MNPRPNDSAVVKAIAEAGGNLNLKNKTPLTMATVYCNVDMVDALLEHGARVDLVAYNGASPITIARTRSNCQHNGVGVGGDSNKCCKIYNLVMKAKEQLENDESLQQSAEELRQKGNVLFSKQEYEEAILAYTESIDCVEDYRTFSNRSACYLKMAEQGL
jgi:tetratricopeptide (TPR) repeat protein